MRLHKDVRFRTLTINSSSNCSRVSSLSSNVQYENSSSTTYRRQLEAAIVRLIWQTDPSNRVGKAQMYEAQQETEPGVCMAYMS